MLSEVKIRRKFKGYLLRRFFFDPAEQEILFYCLQRIARGIEMDTGVNPLKRCPRKVFKMAVESYKKDIRRSLAPLNFRGC